MALSDDKLHHISSALYHSTPDCTVAPIATDNMKHLSINPSNAEPPTRDHPSPPDSLPSAKETKLHPTNAGSENASIFFVGTATTILEWEGVRVMTDPNFLHAGDHVHLGPGVTGERVTNPAIDLHELPRIDVVLLSHYHADHFDQKVEESLRRTLPIITTPHAKSCLTSKGEEESFKNVYDLDFFDSMMVDVVSEGEKDRIPSIKVTGMPGKHVPPGPLSIANDILKAVSTTLPTLLHSRVAADLSRFPLLMVGWWNWATRRKMVEKAASRTATGAQTAPEIQSAKLTIPASTSPATPSW